jgi:hypothetical protein
VRADQIPTIIPALVAGLHAKGIRADVENSAPPAPPAAVARPAPDVAPTAPPAPVKAVAPPSARAVPPPAQSAQIATNSPVAATKPPWIPIAAGAAVVIAALAGWHFLKPHPKSNPVPVAPPTATIVLKYNVDRHLCTPNLNMTVAGKTFHLATNPYAANDVPKGQQQYSIDGLVSCPGRKPSNASGSGVIDVHEGVVFDMNWQSKPGGAGIIEVVDASTEPVKAPEENVRVTKPAATACLQMRRPPTRRRATSSRRMIVRFTGLYSPGKRVIPPVKRWSSNSAISFARSSTSFLSSRIFLPLSTW